MKNHLRAAFGVSVLLAGLLPAAAALADDGHGLGTQIQATVGLHADLGEHENDAVEASTSRAGGREDSDEASNSIRAKSDHQDRDHQGEDVDDENEFEVGHGSMDEASSSIKNADEVGSFGDLRSFLNHALKEDGRLEGVKVSSTTMETRYETEAKLLGFIPAGLTATVTVGNDGSVSVSYPWYAFLFATREDLEGSLKQALSPSLAASSTLSVSASARAHALDLILSVLKD